MLTILWPNVYVVISKMLQCHHHDIKSESNKFTSPTSIFALQIWGYKKKRRASERVTWMQNEGFFKSWLSP